MKDETEKYNEFKQLVLDLFDVNFLIEEDKTQKETFIKTDKAESIIKKHFEESGDRKSAEEADTELLKAYQES